MAGKHSSYHIEFNGRGLLNHVLSLINYRHNRNKHVAMVTLSFSESRVHGRFDRCRTVHQRFRSPAAGHDESPRVVRCSWVTGTSTVCYHWFRVDVQPAVVFCAPFSSAKSEKNTTTINSTLNKRICVRYWLSSGFVFESTSSDHDARHPNGFYLPDTRQWPDVVGSRPSNSLNREPR